MNPLLENARAIAEGETTLITREGLIAFDKVYGRDEFIHGFEHPSSDCSAICFRFVEGGLHFQENPARHERVVALCMAHAILSSP